ncbi:hypothetical protein KC19_9G064400 [Ceratodon purpureus]|uniref:Ribonuclease H2 subunit B n=1 Tax=Ceratodon purpureus TaxID=3225 RepID=A0A8T0GPA7_CERPU|nr:hypothetical protein KC19_9G064400 [Ceratodon purpureus]
MAASEARVLITHCDEDTSAFQRHFLHLRNPVSGKQACYVVGCDGRLQELNWSKQRHTAWFIENSVCADGSLYLATPVDPLFVILPILEQLRMKKGDDMGKFRSLDDIVSVDGYPGYECLRPYLQRSLGIICESREVGEDMFYRLDDSKVLAWLLCKVAKLSEALKSSSGLFSGLHPNELSECLSFLNVPIVRLGSATNVYVIKLLGEYLKMDPWVSPICKHLGKKLHRDAEWIRMP